MIEFLFNLIINPLCLLFEFIFDNIYDFSNNLIFSIFLLSFVVSLLCLPLYLKAEKLQKEEKEIQEKLAKKTNAIKKNFKGDERFFMLQAYYRQNKYNPIMALRSSLGLLLQIPIFIAAYVFFSNLQLLEGAQSFIFWDLSKPDALLRIGKTYINILPFLMTIVNLIAGCVYLKGKSKKEKRVLYITSLVFLVLLYNSPSALVLYWTFNNVFSLIKNLCAKFVKIKTLDIKDYLQGFEYKKILLITLFSLWILIGVCIPSNILIASPYEFMFESDSPLGILWHVIVNTAGIFIFWGICIAYFLNTKLRKVYTLLLILVLFSSVFHLLMFKMPAATLSNTLAFNAYGVQFFTGSKFVFFVLTIVLVLMLAFVVAIVYLRKTKILKTIILSMLFAFVLFSLINVVKINNQIKLIVENTQEDEKIKDKYINLSKKNKNVLIIFADRAISSYIPIIFNEKPELYEKYKGFTYYPNTLSYAQYTLLGYPAVLGGYEYTPTEMDKRKGLYEEKFAQSITVLPAVFSLNGWKSNVINPINKGWQSESWGGVTKEQVETLNNSSLYDKFNVGVESIPASIGDNFKNDIKITSSALTKRNLIFYDFLAVLPLGLRNAFYDNGLYHNPNNNTGNNYSKKFLKCYAELYKIKELTEFASDKNTFIVFNSLLTHNPGFLKYPNYDISLLDNLDYYAPMEDKLEYWSLRHYHVNMAFIKFVGEYFDFLRKNNVYDNTRIIIVSDHGISYGLQNPYLTKFEETNYMPYNPLLMVKDFNQNGKVKINMDFMTNADVPKIATQGIIKNPKNPFSGASLLNTNKKNGVIIKDDTLWQPVYYLGKEKILSDKDKFNYVKENPLKEENWKINLKYKEVLKMLEI